MSRDTHNNLHHLLVGQHIDDGRGADLAVIDPTGRWTFSELDQAAGAAAGLMRRAGVKAGDRVALVMDDGRAWCAAFLGATRLGAVCAPLEPDGRHLTAVLEDLQPRLVVSARPAEHERSRHLVIDPDLLPSLHPDPVQAVEPTTAAYMIFSSGSTGRPKGVMHAHRDLEPSVKGYATEVLELAPGDRCHSVAKCFASLGFGNGFFRPLGRGACIVAQPGRPNVRRTLAAVAEHAVTVLTAVPTFWAQLVTFLDRHPNADALATVRRAVSSGDSLPAAVLEQVRSQTGLDLLEGLGCSECSNIVLSTRPGEPMPGRLGRPVAGAEIDLRDEDGLTVADGTPGRLWIKSPSNTTGYWNRPDETRDVVHGLWIRMGDVLRRDDGVYRHLGRVDDIFKVDARWVSPIEVESVLHEHPAVAAAAVVGVADAEGLTRVGAAIQLRGTEAGSLLNELRRHVAHRLAPYLAPQVIRVFDELPRGATGKVDRRALRELLTD